MNSVLICDDDRIARSVIRELLVGEDYTVLEAADGQQAWDLLQTENVNLLITDWSMPEVDGLELCRRIREAETDRYTYVVMFTAKSDERDLLAAMDAGVDDYLTKPVKREQLLARLRVGNRILGLLARRRQLESLIPICMYCKKARNDQDYWQQLDAFLAENTAAQLSHGICPECLAEHHPEYNP